MSVPLTPTDLRTVLAERARDLSFDLFGVASAISPPDDRDRLRLWLERGYHASMAWMDRTADRRGEIQRVLPGARSVISVAMNYYHPESHDEQCGSLKVSRYAWGEDYHSVVGERLRQLCCYLEGLAPESKCLTYVDTGPIMEKAWAERAGLGWIGKNACLISREVGSWIFLGEIITTAELPQDQPHTDFCGSCTRCLDACPTDAFPEPFVLDSSKCISYWTIEHRGDIPDDLAANFDGWIFGCDICQNVCPWNKFARVSHEESFAPSADCLQPPANRWASLTPEEFKTEFANSPILRTKAEGLARNIHSQSAGHLPVAVRSVSDASRSTNSPLSSGQASPPSV